MAYNPINIEAYTAAFAGAIAGMSTGGWITNPSPASYAALTNIAGAYAQAFDTAWNSAAPLNALEQAAITDAIASEFSGRTPTLSNLALQQASNWTINANACVAAVLQSDAYFAANGLVPPVAPISPIGPSPYSSVTNWWVSPATGSDTNSGTSSSTPLKTKAEIARRLGSWNPTIDGITVTVTMLDPDTSGHDPWLFLPTLLNGASLILTAVLPAPSFTGTLLAVTAKNQTTNGLQSTFTTVTGAIAVKMLLVNTTRGNSRAFAVRNAGAGNWILSQPMTPSNGTVFNTSTEVDTWANGDAILGYALTPVDIGILGCNTPELVFPNPNSLALYNLHVADFSPITLAGMVSVEGVGAYFVCECSSDRYFQGGYYSDIKYPPSGFYNCFLNDGFSLIGPIISAGCGPGQNNTAALFYGQYQNDFILMSRGGAGNQAFTGTHSLYFDNGAFLIVEGPVSNSGGSWYGTGTVNVTGGGNLRYSGNAVSRFQSGITLQLNGLATGYSNANAGGAGGVVTVHGAIALTASALDAAAGNAGFGGFAWGGGAFIEKTATQP